MVANSFNKITSPTIVPTKPNKGAIRAITESMVIFFSILYNSSLPTFSILFSMASIGLPIRCIPLSIILLTGLSLFFARLLAAETLPPVIWSLIILIKFSSATLAFFITNNLSIKTYTASANKIPSGIIIGPPLLNIPITDSDFAVEAATAAVLSTCKKISNIF